MWFIGVEAEQERSAPPPKKILDPPLLSRFAFGRQILDDYTRLLLKAFFFVQATITRQLIFP